MMSPRLMALLAGMLEPAEREVVLGDLAESGRVGGQALCDVAGLIVRRHAPVWKQPVPWLVLIGVVLPFAVLLSIVASRASDGIAFQAWRTANNVRRNVGAFYLLPLLVSCAELACWSWTTGIVVGALSPRTRIVNVIVFCGIAIVGTLLYGPPLPPPSSLSGALATMVFAIAVQLVLTGCIVVLPSRVGILAGGFTGGRTLPVFAALSTVLMTLHSVFVGGFPLQLEIMHGSWIDIAFDALRPDSDLLGYCLLWPTVYWIVQPVLRRRARP